jgi:hypothetical protein
MSPSAAHANSAPQVCERILAGEPVKDLAAEFLCKRPDSLAERRVSRHDASRLEKGTSALCDRSVQGHADSKSRGTRRRDDRESLRGCVSLT